jgi:hypothetical protein
MAKEEALQFCVDYAGGVDEALTCEGLGTFKSLSVSLARDIVALANT